MLFIGSVLILRIGVFLLNPYVVFLYLMEKCLKDLFFQTLSQSIVSFVSGV